MPLADNSWVQTRDINLAAALASFSETAYADQVPIQKFKDHDRGGQEFTVFKFRSDKLTSRLRALWDNPDELDKHASDIPPEMYPAVLCYMHKMMHNRNRLLDAVKRGYVWNIITRDGKIYFIPKEDKKP